MTASLPCFLNELLKAKNHPCRDSSSSLVEIPIIDDNARLTPETRFKNIVSFANNATTGEECHQNSRWCSQPSLVTSIINHQRSHSGSSRRRSSIGTYTDDNATAQKRNQAWNVVDVMVDDHAKKSKFQGMQSDDISSCNPPISSLDCQRHKLSCLSEPVLDAPARLPQRYSSPGALQERVREKRKNSDRPARNSLHSALGDLAPKSCSSLVVERRSFVGKTEYAPSTRRAVRTTMISMDKKEVGSERTGTTKRI